MTNKLPLPDDQPVAVNALRTMRAKLAGLIAMHEDEVQQLRADLVHIDGVLRLFDPETDPEGLPIRKAFPRRMAYFAKAEISHRVYDACETAPVRDPSGICPIWLLERAKLSPGWGPVGADSDLQSESNSPEGSMS